MAVNLCKKKENKNTYTCVDKPVEAGEAGGRGRIRAFLGELLPRTGQTPGQVER